VSGSQTVLFEYGGIEFEWHGPKAVSNRRKHGVTFEEGATIFGDERSLLLSDADSDDVEERWILLARSSANRLLAVVHAVRGERIRIISARLATNEERRTYE
jgi:uncharacterized DUF497 family protein